MGQEQAARQYDMQLRQTVAQVRSEFEQQLNRIAGGLRREAREAIERRAAGADQMLANLASIAEALKVTAAGGAVGSEPGVLRIERIPGERLPYVALAEIPIQANDMSPKEVDWPVPTEGPFIATRRWATFLSAYEFEVVIDEDTGQKVKYPGRSYGRYRPPHSSADILDGQTHFSNAAQQWLLAWGEGNGVQGYWWPSGVLALPSTHSSFRTMQFDGRIEIRNAGSQMPRQNRGVPSAFWAEGTNGPVELPALDIFERASSINFKVTPTHVANPPAGNVAGDMVFPNPAANGWPLVAGQYDPHEGVATPGACYNNLDAKGGWHFEPRASEPVTRLPDGFLILALEGYRIIQPPGLVP
jgi:hypothetical protein